MSISSHLAPNLRLSETAAQRIKQVVIQENTPNLMVRLAVLGGGCSGFQYRFDFDAASSDEDDVIIERDGARLVVDKVSLKLLEGSEIDYSESLMEAGFRVHNPKAVSSCGCGSSFDIEAAVE